MLIIPLPTGGLATLTVLITDNPAADGTPACTPDLAARLLERWQGARLREHRGERYVCLPLTKVRRAA